VLLSLAPITTLHKSNPNFMTVGYSSMTTWSFYGFVFMNFFLSHWLY